MRGVEKFIIILLLAAAVIIPACSQNETPKQSIDSRPAADSAVQAATVTTPSGLAYVDLTPGTGPAPVSGKRVKVHYTGRLENGRKFDSSVDRGEPFVFTIGAGEVIPGWDEGVATMKQGGKRKLIVPSKLGYGPAGAGGVIPPDATLIFEVELLDVEK